MVTSSHFTARHPPNRLAELLLLGLPPFATTKEVFPPLRDLSTSPALIVVPLPEVLGYLAVGACLYFNR
jgi:hypothetical protein